jgi:hypothetical protein
MGTVARMKDLVTSINVEPVYLMFWVSLGMYYIPSQELYVQKACRVNLQHPEAACDNISNNTEIQLETQQLVAGIQV